MENIFALFRSASSIQVSVRPGAPQTKLRGMMKDGTIKIDIAAPAEDNEANKELLRFLQEDCEIPHIEIMKGMTNRKKILRISSLEN